MTFQSQMIIIMGATGDLTRRKLLPALYHLVAKQQLSDCTPIICIGRRDLSTEQFLDLVEPAQYLETVETGVLRDLVKRIEYLSFDIDKGNPTEFGAMLEEVVCRHGCTRDKLVYLALPTGGFAKAVGLIDVLGNGEGTRRVVFEKPFGYDVESARRLNEQTGSVLAEEEMYRVDHYLGKELVRNILTLRFGNGLFNSVWNRETVEQVQITVSESLGVGTRAGYYDKSGAVRDMIQNHLLQLLCLTAMEPPADSSPDSLRDVSVGVLKALRPPVPKDVVLGQYGPGRVAGEDLPGYREEEGVADDSGTETYAALRIHVDSDRWRDVPFYLRTGKRLRSRYAEIKVVFRRPETVAGGGGEQNVITIRIQPDEGIALSINVQRPGMDNQTASVLMDFCHHCHFGPNTPEAYESILRRVMQGDHSIFPRWDWIEAGWQWVDELYRVASPVEIYPAGTTGPQGAERLLAEDGRRWLDMEPIERVIPVVSSSP